MPRSRRAFAHRELFDGKRESFRFRTANLKPYSAISPRIPLTDRNPANGAGAKESARMDFSEEDRIDDDELNEVLWRALKHSPAPAVRGTIPSRTFLALLFPSAITDRRWQCLTFPIHFTWSAGAAWPHQAAAARHPCPRGPEQHPIGAWHAAQSRTS